MLEIEMKFSVSDFSALEQHMANWRATPQLAIEEADHYFNAPDRDFARTDEAFRLRCIGIQNRITYKGPKQGGLAKTRTEIELALEPGAEAADKWRRLAVALGYRPTAVVKKRRTCYDFQRGGFALQACCDEVESLGRFVEIEIVTNAEQKQRAQDVILQTTRELGLTSSEQRSYLEMVLANLPPLSLGTPGERREIQERSRLTPTITTTVADTRNAIAAARTQGKRIGLVPTMGALHAGHESLIQTARRETDFVVVSIFVNQTQFGPKEDLSRYPRPFDADVALCARANVDLVFQPTPEVMYPASFKTFVEVNEMQNVLCGAARLGHFRGVATVVLKLFNILQPDVAYFGQKDAQQARLLMQMVRDLDVPVELRICPIVRAADGLALSSRNVYLDSEQRRHATVLFRALELIRARIDAGERQAEPLIRAARALIDATPGARVDYVAIVDFGQLQPIERLQGEVLVALAVYFGTTRLIDNMLIDVGHVSNVS